MENQEKDINPNENANLQENPSSGKPKKRRVRRWIIWLSIISFIFFVIVPILANFYADRIFGETAREIIRLETNREYTFDYGDISFNLFKNNLTINNLVIAPDSTILDSITGSYLVPDKYMELHIEEFHLKASGLLSVILNRELTIESFNLEKPVLKLVVPQVPIDTTANPDTLKHDKFNYRELHTYIEDYLSLLQIVQFDLSNGALEIHKMSADSAEVIRMDNISVQVANFYLDSVSNQRTEKLFFSDSLGIKIKGGFFDLEGKKHKISFRDINISAEGQTFELLDAVISKDSTLMDFDDEAWFEIKVPGILISGIDYNGMLNGKLLAKQILISRPGIRYALPHKSRPENRSTNIREEILKEVAAVFYPVDVKKVIIDHANLELENFLPGAIDNFHLPDLSLELFQVRIDSSFITEQRPLYFIADFNLSLENQKLVLKKPQQEITFDTLNFDTRNSTFMINQLNIASLDEAMLRFEATITIPELKIVGKDFKKDFVDRNVNLELVELLGPVVNLELDPLISKGGKKSNMDDINELTGGMLESLSVDKFRLIDAALTFNNGSGMFDKQLITDKLNIEIDGFDLPADSLQAIDKIFYSSAIELDVENFEFKLPDSVHQLSLHSLVLDTRKGFINFNGIEIDTLKTIAGSTFIQGDHMKVAIEKFNASAVDFLGIYKQEYIDIGEIIIQSPNVHLCDARENDNKPLAKIPGFFKNYSLGRLSISGLDLLIEKAIHERTSIEFSKGNILATGINPLSLEQFDEILTDSLELSFDGVFYQPGYGKQLIATDHLLISKKDSLLQVKNFKLYPGNFKLDNFKNGFSLLIPEVEITCFDIHGAIYHKELVARDVIAQHTLFRMVMGKPDVAAKSHSLDISLLKRELLKIFDKWDVETVAFENSAIKAYSGNTYSTEIINVNDFTVRLDDLFLDSSVDMTRDNVLFAGDIQFHLNTPVAFNGKKDQLVALKDFSLSTGEGRIVIGDFVISENQSMINPVVIDESNAFISIDEAEISGIDFYDYIENKKLGIDSIRVEQPKFLLKREYSASKEKAKSQSKIDLYTMISDHLFEIRVNDFEVHNATFMIKNAKDGENSTFIVNRVDVDMNNILVDSSNEVFSNKFLYSDDLDLNIRDYSYNTANGLYTMGASNISFSSEDALLLIDSGFVTPLLQPEAFAKKVGVQTDRLDFAFDSARLENFRLYDLFYNNYFRADYFYLKGLEGEDYRDKYYERPLNHFPRLPASGLKNLDFGVRLDSARIVNSCFTYRELKNPDTIPGRIWFDDISVMARNITNDEELIDRNSIMGFKVQTKLMGEGLIDMTALFFLRPVDSIFVSATLNAMDLTSMNPLLEHIAFVKVKKGQNELLDFHFNANNDLSTGEMNFEYNNLAIRLINKESLQPKGFGGGVASFVANAFVVRSKNPAWGIFNRKGDIYFPRDKTRSFFNYLAKSFLSGVSSTIRGGNEERKENRIKKKAERKQGDGEGDQ